MSQRRRGPERVELTVGLDQPEDEASLRSLAAKQVGCSIDELPPVRLLKRSLDARGGKIRFHLSLALGEEAPRELGLPHPVTTRGASRVVVVGDGPAGLFAAYQLARQGIRSTVIDRGKAVQPRRKDLKLLNARGGVNPDSNYCFGEGGAGTYSDGKLYTRSHKRGPVRDVMEILALHGAPADILTEARPHIGSNLLPRIISAMRERLEDVGVEFRFGCRMVDLLLEGEGAGRRVVGVLTQDVETGRQEELTAEAVVVATGHSARDVFAVLAEAGAHMEFKPFALGVRVEHPQELINRIQFGRHAGHPKLGAAAYRAVHQVEGRGVFSFCMCPGGWIVPAMTDEDHLVVNGMSLSKRDSPYANSGVVAAVEEEDVRGMTGPTFARGVELQKRVEAFAQRAGGGSNRAPATRLTDFIAGRASTTLSASSYLPGLTATDLNEVLDSAHSGLSDRLRKGLQGFARKLRGYVSEEAVVVGVESRTSAPLRVVRDETTWEARGLAGLFVAGEGAGYAGGIVSAAVDGLRAAEQVAERVRSGG